MILEKPDHGVGAPTTVSRIRL